jgi:hypothetical protein
MWEKIGPRSPFIVTIVVSFLATIPAWFKFKLPKSSNGEKPSGNEEIKES